MFLRLDTSIDRVSICECIHVLHMGLVSIHVHCLALRPSPYVLYLHVTLKNWLGLTREGNFVIQRQKSII